MKDLTATAASHTHAVRTASISAGTPAGELQENDETTDRDVRIESRVRVLERRRDLLPRHRSRAGPTWLDVTFYEPDAYERQAHRDIPDPEWARVVVYPIAVSRSTRTHSKQARSADIIVKTSGVGVFDALLESAVLEYKARHALAIFWDVDAPATLDRLEQDPSIRSVRWCRSYDMVLTYGGGQPGRYRVPARSARACVCRSTTHWIPRPIFRSPRRSASRPTSPFSATACPIARARVEEFFLSAAAALPTHRFLIGGNGWHDKPMPRNVQYVGHVYTRDHNAFNCTPRAVLNISRDSMARYGSLPPRGSSKPPAPARASLLTRGLA